MAGKPKLQPLPKKLSEDPGRVRSAGKTDITVASNSDPAKKKKESSSSSKIPITPRRLALKFDSQTIVIEYKEQETGKLRHRSFRIDTSRFESTDECVKKLWRRLSKAVVPGSLKEEQLERLVSKLFASTKSKDSTAEFDDDDLDAATDRLLAQQVELPAPTLPSNTPKEPEAPSPAAAKSEDESEEEDPKPSSGSALGSLGSLSGLPTLKGKGSGGLLKPMQPMMSGGAMPMGMGATDASDEDEDEDGWTPPGRGVKKDAVKEGGGAGAAKAKEEEKKEEKKKEEEEEEEIEYASDFEDVDIEESPRPAAHDGEEEKEGARKKGGEEGGEEEEDDGIPEEKRKEIMAKIKEGEIDLQKVPAEDLAMYKRLMDVEFRKNALRPGDEGYKHDIQVEFEEPDEDAGWDEDDDYVPSDDDF